MKKSYTTILLTVLLCTVFVTYTFMGTMNSNGAEIYNISCNCDDSNAPLLFDEADACLHRGLADKDQTDDAINFSKSARPTSAKMIRGIYERCAVVFDNKDGVDAEDQTGFSLNKAVVVLTAALATLCGAYSVSRKIHLFV